MHVLTCADKMRKNTIYPVAAQHQRRLLSSMWHTTVAVEAINIIMEL